MTKLIIGDFRSTQLQHYVNKYNESQENKKQDDEEAILLDFDFLIDNGADYNWFSNVVTTQINYNSSEIKHIIINLGFNDCVYSSVFKTFKLDTITDEYIKTIDKLIEDHASINFYFCAINPVSGDYPFAIEDTLSIQKDILNNNIEKFNTKIKENCKATFIDCYNYLVDTNINTYDGVRYLFDTCDSIISIININLKTSIANSFIKRTKAPNPDSNDIESDMFWVDKTYNGGLNIYSSTTPTMYKKSQGDVLPNCTSYVWGRWYEILRTEHKLIRANAEYFYGNDKEDGYERGDTPKVGAVICWQAGEIGGSGADDAGHVGIVEEVLPDGSIITSESGYNTEAYWWVKKRDKNGYWKGHYDEDGNFIEDASGYIKVSEGNWGAGSNYTFQGFIYCPITNAGVVAAGKGDVIYQERNAIEDVEKQKKNVEYIWQYFGALGWTPNAVAGMVGNMQNESGFNPWRWEADYLSSSDWVDGDSINADGTHSLNQSELEYYYNHPEIYRKGTKPSSPSYYRYPGYGLVQWTPYSKFIDWCENKNGMINPTGKTLKWWDIDSQLLRIQWEAENEQQWLKKSEVGNISFLDFTKSTKDVRYLAEAFLRSYERPNIDAKKIKDRGDQAEFWYNHIKLIPLGTTDNSLQVHDLKAFNIDAISTKVSFLIRNGKTGFYKITYPDGTTSEQINLNVKCEEANDGEADRIKNIILDLKNLIPNSYYKLYFKFSGIIDNDEKELELEFTTPQDYPKSDLNIVLTPENLAMSDQNFKLSTTGTVNFGYWGKNDKGFIIQSIINGKKYREKIIENPVSEKFNLIEHELFKGTNIRIGDTIQIGMRTWVKDDSGILIYDRPESQMSNSVCLLEKPILTYLNK